MLTREPAAPGGLAGRREWIGLALLVLPALLVAMDITALFLALPRLSRLRDHHGDAGGPDRPPAAAAHRRRYPGSG